MMSTRLNSNDHGPAIIITAGIMLGTATIAIAMRLYQRWPWSNLLKPEDFILLAAMILGIANIAMVSVAVKHGLGQRFDRLTTDQIDSAKGAMVASFALTVLTEGFAAISFLVLLRNMKPEKSFKHLMTALSSVVATWAIAAMARFAAASSDSVAPLDRVTWVGFTVVGMLIQIVLFAAAMWTIWPLQMATSRKIGISLWFSLCLPLAAVMAVRLAFTPAETFATNFTWKDINMVIILIIESNLAIINAAYPSVRSFLNKVSTGFLVAETAKDSKTDSKVASRYGFGRNSVKGGSYGLETIGGTGRNNKRMRDGTVDLRDQTIGQHSATIRGETKSDRSFGSEVIMVRRSVEIDEVSMPESSSR